MLRNKDNVTNRGVRLSRVAGAVALALGLFTVPIAAPGAMAAAGQQAGDDTYHAPFNIDDPIWVDPDDLTFNEPSGWSTLQLYDVYENLFLDPGDPVSRRAMNINTLGEVPDSSWFVNRLGHRTMSIEEITTGPNLTGGPVPKLFTVIGRPSGGITPKFLVEDVAGQRFIFKFDPMSNPEMASAAEMICSKFFYAAGYNVGESYILKIHKDQLRIAEGAVFENSAGEETPITYEDLDHWMANAPSDENGVYRVLASGFIPGVKVGEFRFHGTRSDDPNDIFPHEHRRELRAYRAFAAWLNHDDSRATNTYDAFVGDWDQGYIKHYLLDFGSCLGSASIVANKLRGGNEYFLEKGPILRSMVTLGLWRRPWLDVEFPDFPAVGNLEAERFEPGSWKPEYPNAAFDRMDAADAFWGARIAAMFTDDIVHAVVETAEISDPEAENYLAETIIRRRDKVVRYWLTATNPLESFDVGGSASSATLRWVNAAARMGVATPAESYEVQWSALDNETGSETLAGNQVVAQLLEAKVPPAAWGPRDAMGDHYARARIATRHEAFSHWRRPVVVTLRDRDGDLSIVGIARPRRFTDRAES